MAKSPGAGFLNHLASEVQTRATCWAMFANFRRASVSGITQANPAVVTTNEAHALTTGNFVTLQEVAGMTEVNDIATGTWIASPVTVLTDTTFELDDIDSSGYGAYTSGGIVRDVLGFTDHISNLVVDGITYYAESAFTSDAINTSESGSVDTAEVSGILDSTVMVSVPAVLEADIIAGRFNLAEVRMFQVDYTESPISSKLWLRRGWLGNFESIQDQYRAELRGMTDILTQQTLEVYSPGCRYDLGSSRCTVDLASFTTTGSVSGVTDRDEFASGVGGADQLYTYGLVTWTSGDNTGLKMEVKGFSGGSIILFEKMPYEIQVGDGFSISQGCDKKLETCRDIFDNVINHGGYFYLPGTDTVTRVVEVKRPVIITSG